MFEAVTLLTSDDYAVMCPIRHQLMNRPEYVDGIEMRTDLHYGKQVVGARRTSGYPRY
jgi:hypothetical protein